MLVQASQDALRHLEIIMVGTKFPENIGMAARACANTGCGRLTLVSPAWWDKEKARPLATAKGEPLLDAIEVKPTLGDALAPNVLTFGTTARTGGWRRGLLTPEQAAALDSGACKPTDYFVCAGKISVAGTRFRCANGHVHGAETFAQGLAVSCNPCFIQIGARLGKERFCDYFAAFGLREATGIDLPGEIKRSEYYTADRMGPVNDFV